ncbi:MAG: lytic transglycosylase, partial [Rhodococcus sp. (in: high G+C Gram-positive bacteria)]
MSVDASAVIVAVATAASALVQGIDIPGEVKDQVTQVIESFEQSAPGVDKQVADMVAALPESVRPAAQQAVADATNSVATAIEPHLPPEAVAALVAPGDGPPPGLAPAAPAPR